MNQKKNNSHGENLTRLRGAAQYMGLGTQLAVTMVAFFFFGYWLDGEFETLPLFVIVFSFIGAGGGLYSFIRNVIKLNEKKNDN